MYIESQKMSMTKYFIKFRFVATCVIICLRCVFVLQRVAACCSVLQCVAACCSVLQCVAVCCNVPHVALSMCDVYHPSAHGHVMTQCDAPHTNESHTAYTSRHT